MAHWPGTQRLLLWADPVFAAAYSRAFQFCGSAGVEIMEPLSFKGRRGSGIAGTASRCAYADAILRPRWDWEKYLDTYRVWGHKLFDPNAEVQVDPALAAASRILPIVTTAYLPSAANNNYWPELYTNQSLVEPSQTEYTDTASPKTFGNASPLDPQLFSGMNEFADELLRGRRSGKYSPVEVAQWLEDLAAAAKPAGPSRAAVDIAIQAGVGKFFASKFRAGVLYAIYERTGERAALEAALKFYRMARAAWADAADAATGVYVPDITAGELPWLRGHWLDRLPGIDADIALLEARLPAARSNSDPKIDAAIAETAGRPERKPASVQHRPPDRFQRKRPLSLELTSRSASAVLLHYRHVNQAERWQAVPMDATGAAYRAAIPGAYTDSPYPLQYYFEISSARGPVLLYPGLPPNLAGVPYFVTRGYV